MYFPTKNITHTKGHPKSARHVARRGIPVSPAVVQVDLRGEAGGLADGALLGSGRCRLRGCWCVKARHRLAGLSRRLAGLGVRLTHLSGCLARLAAPLSGLSDRAGLGLGAVFLCHGALLL